MINITLMNTNKLTVEIHANATTDMNSLSALVKVLQFRPEITHVILSGVIAQIEYAKKQKATKKKLVAPLKA